jgi:hypothetical protein
MTAVAPIVVRVPHKLTSLDQAHKVLDSVLGRLGCGACLSGFDIRFTHAVDLAINPKTLQVEELGR